MDTEACWGMKITRTFRRVAPVLAFLAVAAHASAQDLRPVVENVQSAGITFHRPAGLTIRSRPQDRALGEFGINSLWLNTSVGFSILMRPNRDPLTEHRALVEELRKRGWARDSEQRVARAIVTRFDKGTVMSACCSGAFFLTAIYDDERNGISEQAASMIVQSAAPLA